MLVNGTVGFCGVCDPEDGVDADTELVVEVGTGVVPDTDVPDVVVVPPFAHASNKLVSRRVENAPSKDILTCFIIFFIRLPFP